ncbi:glycosyltransferase [Aquabacter spiritensis]|uniref:Glycosyl transferase family 2 n=1 Tax=Aquabacter spiritensis TaxID=933073 RepID=A0A4R3LRJ2_9HYPH|nr:glycosyltransferase [Aquabacter spiritensis]TCT03214.1 glycosyl transferase family 2 [Aquabacter spiritensis]
MLTKPFEEVPPRLCAWRIAVFARNERPTLVSCLQHIARAAAGRDAHVTVILNGSSDGSAHALADAAPEIGIPFDVYEIDYADKSNAINQFVHRLRADAEIYFFVDAYAMIGESALRDLAAALAANPRALAAAAVPSVGRSADAIRAQMMVEPGLHGSLFALRGEFVARMAETRFRLPVGLYRGDGLIGSAVMHDLDALRVPWTWEHIAVAPGATWRFRPLSPWSAADRRRQWNRLLRQGRGEIEDMAIKRIIYEGNYAALPDFASALVRSLVREDRGEVLRCLRRRPAGILAVREAFAAPDPAPAALAPRRILTAGA